LVGFKHLNFNRLPKRLRYFFAKIGEISGLVGSAEKRYYQKGSVGVKWPAERILESVFPGFNTDFETIVRRRAHDHTLWFCTKGAR
jgi:hypothetical protein